MIHPIELATNYGAHVERLAADYCAAVTAAKYDSLVIHSGAAAKQSPFDDQYWHHKPTPAFAHWVPLGEPEAAVIVRPGDRPLLVRTRVNDFWESAPQPEGDHFWNFFELVEVSEPTAVADYLPSGRVAFIGDVADRAASWGIDAPAINPPGLVAELDHVRAIKSKYEVQCIREANRRAMRGHEAVGDAFMAGGVSELELHLMYLRITRQDDVDTPYKNIVAQGSNSAVLHHVRYGRAPSVRPYESLLIDAGATYMGYASDITRTHSRAPDGGDVEVNIDFEHMCDSIQAIQNLIIGEIEVGKPYEKLHDRTHEILAYDLYQYGIAEASVDELIGNGITRRFFPHGLGHSLGIQVHDVGCRDTEPRADNPFLRNTTAITEGQVFTIEPGFYIIDGLLEGLRDDPRGSCINWNAVERLRPFGGIRIEDNIAIVDGRAQNLTRGNDTASAKS